jgi:hypothetical protein
MITMDIDLTLVAAAITTGIAFVMASLGAKYHQDYSKLLIKLGAITGLAKEITASIDVIVEALQDDAITKEELEVVVDHLTSLKDKLEGMTNA